MIALQNGLRLLGKDYNAGETIPPEEWREIGGHVQHALKNQNLVGEEGQPAESDSVLLAKALDAVDALSARVAALEAKDGGSVIVTPSPQRGRGKKGK